MTKLIVTILISLIGLIAMCAIAFDFYVISKTGTAQNTISKFVNDLARLYPIIPLIAGLIVGGLLAHFFWTIS